MFLYQGKISCLCDIELEYVKLYTGVGARDKGVLYLLIGWCKTPRYILHSIVSYTTHQPPAPL